MYKNKSIGVIVPCYNEEKQISKVLDTMPDIVDNIIIVDDKSTDNTQKIIEKYLDKNKKITFLAHKKNQGIGGALTTGYKWARDQKIDVAVVMAGDAQMDPKHLTKLLDPVVSGKFNFSKGNRLKYPGAFSNIPKTRFFGNQVLSFFTKIASGYWKITDVQNGYTALDLKVLETINWDKQYKRYGQPNDLLVKLNIHNFKVCDVIMPPVYGVGEESKMNIKKVLFTIPVLLVKLFFQRIFYKYMVADFNLIAPLYFFGILNFIIFLTFLIRITVKYTLSTTPEISIIMCLHTLELSLFFSIIAMYFDMQENAKLQE